MGHDFRSYVVMPAFVDDVAKARNRDLAQSVSNDNEQSPYVPKAT